MAALDQKNSPTRVLESVGRGASRFADAFGLGAYLFYQSLYWLVMGRQKGQRVRAEPIFAQMMETARYASLGQISNALYDVGGRYRRNM